MKTRVSLKYFVHDCRKPLEKEEGTRNLQNINIISKISISNIIPTSVRPYNTRNASNIPQFKAKHNFFEILFNYQ